jgi:hypothetical protein
VSTFHIAAGAKLCPGQGAIHTLSGAVVKLASINLWKLVLFPTGSINLGFILREDLLLCSSYLLLGFPTGRSSTKLLHQHRTIRHQDCFLAPLLGIEEEEAPMSTMRHHFPCSFLLCAFFFKGQDLTWCPLILYLK